VKRVLTPSLEPTEKEDTSIIFLQDSKSESQPDWNVDSIADTSGFNVLLIRVSRLPTIKYIRSQLICFRNSHILSIPPKVQSPK
jgi:hypothetical protein